MTRSEAIKELEKHTNDTIFLGVEELRYPMLDGSKYVVAEFSAVVWSGRKRKRFITPTLASAVEQAVAWLKAKKSPASTPEEVEQAFADAGVSEKETARGEIVTGEQA